MGNPENLPKFEGNIVPEHVKDDIESEIENSDKLPKWKADKVLQQITDDFVKCDMWKPDKKGII